MGALAVVLLLCLARYATCMEKMVMQRARMEDQESSATGYTYSSGSPTYTKIKDAAAGLAKVELPYSSYHLPTYEFQHVPGVDSSMHYVPKLYENSHYTPYGGPISSDIIEFNKAKYGFNKPWKFGENEVSKHEKEHKESEGEKGEKEFKQLLGWDKANKGHANKEDHKGWYDVAGGNKQGHHEVGDHWESKEGEGKGVKGGKFKDLKGHDKGAKTTGYHKVYVKDEFKKDHEFYDQADRNGHYNKYGNLDTKHSKGEGGYRKGGQQNYGYYADNLGKNGQHDKGYYADADRGFNAARGGDSFHKKYEEFMRNAKGAGGSQYEYNDGNGPKWKF